MTSLDLAQTIDEFVMANGLHVSIQSIENHMPLFEIHGVDDMAKETLEHMRYFADSGKAYQPLADIFRRAEA